MAAVTLILRESHDEAVDTMAFRFRATGLAGAIAGQYLMVRLDAPDDPRHGQRSFTMANSPTESEVMIVTRVRSQSPFKRRMAALRPGDSVKANGPLGRFTLHAGEAPALFLAGGIGVTPFRAMIKAAIDTGRTTPIVLLTSDRAPEMIPFRKEMDAWAASHPWLTIRRTVTRPEASGHAWDGRTGRVDRAWIVQQCPDVERAIAYVAGPPSFVDDVSAQLALVGFPADRLRTERFLGY